MFKLLKISSDLIITLVIILLFFVAWVVIEYGVGLLAIMCVGGAVYLSYNKDNVKRCHCEICDSIYHNDARMLAHKRRLEEIDMEASWDHLR